MSILRNTIYSNKIENYRAIVSMGMLLGLATILAR
jgi:hypothetical protein